jgi:hypothetical protein
MIPKPAAEEHIALRKRSPGGGVARLKILVWRVYASPPLPYGRLPQLKNAIGRGRISKFAANKIFIPILYFPSPNLIVDLGEGWDGGPQSSGDCIALIRYQRERSESVALFLNVWMD